MSGWHKLLTVAGDDVVVVRRANATPRSWAQPHKWHERELRVNANTSRSPNPPKLMKRTNRTTAAVYAGLGGAAVVKPDGRPKNLHRPLKRPKNKA